MKIKGAYLRHNVSEQTDCGWKRKYGGMQVDELLQARVLVAENARHKRIVADMAVQIDILKAVKAKKVGSPNSKRKAAQHSVASGLGRIA